MSIKIDDLMTHTVMTLRPHHTVEHARAMMERHSISALPVVNGDNEPLGILTTSDLLELPKDGRPVSGVMTAGVRTVPQYNDAAVAAKIMRKHHIHHVVVTHDLVFVGHHHVVTHEHEIVGIISSFDLLALVSDSRFVAKPKGSKNKHKHARA